MVKAFDPVHRLPSCLRSGSVSTPRACSALKVLKARCIETLFHALARRRMDGDANENLEELRMEP